MPGIVVFNRRWSVGSDDLVVPALFLVILHTVWIIVLGVILGVLQVDTSVECSKTLQEHVLGYIVIMSGCLVIESCIVWISMRGTILDPAPRKSMQYLLYIRLAVFIVEVVWLVIGVVWVAQNFNSCSAQAPKRAILGVIVCNWVILLSVLISLWCTFDAAGRSWVKMKRYQESLKEKEGRPQRHKRRSGAGSGRRNWRHRKAMRKYEQSWDRRCKVLFCCVKEDRHRNSFTEVARLFTEFFRDLDVVPTDIVAGLMLLRRQQKQRRKFIIGQSAVRSNLKSGSNEVYQFLSGVPISPSTKFLSLKDPDVLFEYKKVIHYMRYALAAYGWPMYMMMNTGAGLCKIMPHLSCCMCCCRGQSGFPELVEDNCCECNFAALKKLGGVKSQNVVYCTYHVDIGETPFFIAVDHEQKSIVISIRGTLSLQDVLTDLKAEPETIPIEPVKEDWLGHKGMVQAAVYIKKKIKDEMLLSKALRHDEEQGTQDYDLVLIGHSLGAGTAAILAILLHQEYPALHCYAFSPPGGLISATCVEETKSFITSVVVGKDVVPRIGLYQLETLRQDLINVIKNSSDSKWNIIGGSVLCCCCGDGSKKSKLDDSDPALDQLYEQNRQEKESRYFTHPTDSQIALTQHIPLYPPGKIIHVVRSHPKNKRNKPEYRAIEVDNYSLDKVIVSNTMLEDHKPFNVLECLQLTLDPLNSSSSDNFDEKIVNNCISNLYIPPKLVTSILQLSQTKFISSLVQENIFGVLTSSKISLRSLGVKWLKKHCDNCVKLFSVLFSLVNFTADTNQTLSICKRQDPVYQAVWAGNMDFDEVVISPTMINDHMPDNVMDALEKVLTNVSPAKPTRKYTEEERKAMIADPDPSMSYDPIVPESRAFLESSFMENCGAPNMEQQQQHPQQEFINGEQTGIAYSIPPSDGGTLNTSGDNSTNLSWEYGVSPVSGVRNEGETRCLLRPKSYPAKPRPNFKLDFFNQREDIWSAVSGEGAPLATPETLSSASSLNSLASKRHSSQIGYQRLLSDGAALETIQQSPLRATKSEILTHRLSNGHQCSPTRRTCYFGPVDSNHGVPTSVKVDNVVGFNNIPIAESTPVRCLAATNSIHDTAVSNDTSSKNSLTNQRNSIFKHQDSCTNALLSPIRDESEHSDVVNPIEICKAFVSPTCNPDSLSLTAIEQNEITVINNSTPSTPYMRHSPDSTNQTLYDIQNYHYSHAGMGYPHGAYINGLASSSCNTVSSLQSIISNVSSDRIPSPEKQHTIANTDTTFALHHQDQQPSDLTNPKTVDLKITNHNLNENNAAYLIDDVIIHQNSYIAKEIDDDDNHDIVIHKPYYNGGNNKQNVREDSVSSVNSSCECYTTEGEGGNTTNGSSGGEIGGNSRGGVPIRGERMSQSTSPDYEGSRKDFHLHIDEDSLLLNKLESKNTAITAATTTYRDNDNINNPPPFHCNVLLHTDDDEDYKMEIVDDDDIILSGDLSNGGFSGNNNNNTLDGGIQDGIGGMEDDNVSLSDSEPFMTTHIDSDSQSASPSNLYTLIHSGMFVQESEV